MKMFRNEMFREEELQTNGKATSKKIKVGASKRCCYRLCKSDSRTKDFYENFNFYFITFPKPCLAYKQNRIEKSKLQSHIKGCYKCKKCSNWVRLCGRSDTRFKSMINVSKDSYICSLHFVGESGPTEENPDPVKYEFSSKTQKKPYKKRKSLEEKYQSALNTSYKTPVQEKKLHNLESENMDNLKFEPIQFNDVIIKTEDIIEEQNDVVLNELFSTTPEKNQNPLSLVPEKQDRNVIKNKKNVTVWKFGPKTSEIIKKSVSVQTPKMLLNSKKLKNPRKPTDSCKCNPMQNFEESLKLDEEKCIFYTGLKFRKVKLLLSFLSPACKNLIYWDSHRNSSKVENRTERKFTLTQELIITLIYMRCAPPLLDLAYRFDTPVYLITSIIITWIQLMHLEFTKHIKPKMFLTRHQVAEEKSLLFKGFQNLRVIITCTELYCPSSPLLNYEHHDHTYSVNQTSIICKALIGCTPSGTISFVSPVYEGTTSNREIFMKMDILNSLEPKDLIFTDDTLDIRDLIQSKGAQLRVPEFLDNDHYLQNIRNFDKDIVQQKKRRKCVEETIGRIKLFRILQNELPISMKSIMSQLVFVCACIVNMNLS